VMKPHLDFNDTTEVSWAEQTASPNRNTESPVSDVGSEVFTSSASTSSGASTIKRKKNKKDPKIEENVAMDPMRYKTKMCKNWQTTEKCPYGPRCLFAHGSKEMRSHLNNHSAISSAAATGSPERQFYAMGHFPSFMPVPFTAAATENETPEPQQVQAAPFIHTPYQISPPINYVHAAPQPRCVPHPSVHPVPMVPSNVDSMYIPHSEYAFFQQAYLFQVPQYGPVQTQQIYTAPQASYTEYSPVLDYCTESYY